MVALRFALRLLATLAAVLMLIPHEQAHCQNLRNFTSLRVLHRHPAIN